jgi:hypothetical protein
MAINGLPSSFYAAPQSGSLDNFFTENVLARSFLQHVCVRRNAASQQSTLFAQTQGPYWSGAGQPALTKKE